MTGKVLEQESAKGVDCSILRQRLEEGAVHISYPVSWAITFVSHLVCFIVFYRKTRKSVLPAQR